jgi:hypothetical protein
MFVYALTEPIDLFDGLTPLPEWIAQEPTPRTRWALQAILALNDAATAVRWSGDMRHLPSVGVALNPPGTNPYLVVKQDNNGTTFVVTDIALPLPADEVEHRTHVQARPFGAWTHPTHADVDRDTACDEQGATVPALTPVGQGHEAPY